MLFINRELTKVLQEAFLWTDEQLEGMETLYFDTILKLIINDTFDYISKNSLPENFKVDQLQKKYALTKDIKIQNELIKFLFSISDKYIELQNHLLKRINEINADLTEDFVEAMDYETGLKVLAIMDKDLTSINQFENKFLKFPKQESSEK